MDKLTIQSYCERWENIFDIIFNGKTEEIIITTDKELIKKLINIKLTKLELTNDFLD